MSSLLWGIAQASVTYAASYLQKNKGPQQLDPIATLCMLALRNLPEYDKAKPSVVNNQFYWTKHQFWMLEGAKRGFSKVSHEDFPLLEQAIDDLIAYWNPNMHSTLAKIATYAIEALPKADLAYENKLNCVKGLAELYQTKLEKWLAAAMSDSKQAIAVSQPMDSKNIKKIKQIWSEEKINHFYLLYTNQTATPMENFLQSQHEVYYKNITRQ